MSYGMPPATCCGAGERHGGFAFSAVLRHCRGCYMVAVEVPSGGMPGAVRASLRPARWGDLPSPGDNLPIVGHGKQGGDGQARFLLQHWHRLTLPSAFKVNSDIWANCCFEGGRFHSFTFPTGSLWLCLPPPTAEPAILLPLFPSCG